MTTDRRIERCCLLRAPGCASEMTPDPSQGVEGCVQREVDLASFGPDFTFGFELGLEFRFGLELGLGDGEIDHEAESVGKLPCR
jgi:hypothetical protein